MRQFTLFVNFSKSGAAALARAVCAELFSQGLVVWLSPADVSALETVAPFSSIDSLNVSSTSDCLEEAEAVLAIGGDGTILRAARMAFHKPVLGINAGRLGFLAGLEQSELPLLRGLARDSFVLDQRMLLSVEVWRDDALEHESLCVNDATISRLGNPRLAELCVNCGGTLHFFGDGVLFSTPTGSTAYSFSAGGPILDPALSAILLTPICSHSPFARSVVFSPETEFSVNIHRDGLGLVCDAEPPLLLVPGQKLTISRAFETAKFIRLKQEHFLHTLNGKFCSASESFC